MVPVFPRHPVIPLWEIYADEFCFLILKSKVKSVHYTVEDNWKQSKYATTEE